MKHTLHYGTEPIEFELNWGHFLGALDVRGAEPVADVPAAVREALSNPIGLNGPMLSPFRSGERVAILVSDAFRHTGADQFLPVLVEELHAAGIRDEDIFFLFATGTHRAPNETEQARILGEDLYRRFQGQAGVHNASDPERHVYLGATSRGTPVWINKHARDCDRIIATGTVVMHYHAGFGGGRKSILPGIASVETISHNHSLNLDREAGRINPAVRIATLDGNPVAEDMAEGARMAGADGILNTVMNREGRIAGIFAGELDAAHRTATRFAMDLFGVEINEQADFVIASSGGTRNFVQSHKALFNAYQAIKPGGRIVFVAKCEEGLGGSQFSRWLGLGSPAAIIAELQREGEIYGQTALSTIQKAPATFIVTDLEDEDVERIGARRAASVQEALMLTRHAMKDAHITNPTYYLMPSAAYTVPFLNPK